MKKILTFGSINMDLSIYLKKMPQKGETVSARRISYQCGGKGANQACAMGKLGARTTMLGCVGQDLFGKKQLENLKMNHVDISYIRKIPEKSTGTAIIYVDDNGDNSIVVAAGANKDCNREYLQSLENLFSEYDFFVFQMEVPHDAVYYGIEQARKSGKTIILNPAPAPETIPETILEKIDYLTPNETELITLSALSEVNMENIRKGAGFLLEKGVKNVLVTLGEKGSLLVNREKEILYPARKVQAKDTTGAGDCFNGAFVTALAEGKTADEAIRFANLASSIAVTREGAQSALPEREEVEALFSRI